MFTEDPVYVAKIPTTEYGDIVRLWEFDRFNNTLWSVDIVLVGNVLFTHVTITNPTPLDLRGYWWTCVAMRVNITSGLTRIITPAALSTTPCVDWPTGAWTLSNGSFAGSPGAWDGDMSFIGNLPSAHDFFMYGWREEFKYPLPHITWAEDDGYAVVHAHGKRDAPRFMNGTKFFTWGNTIAGMFQCDWMSCSDYENEQCRQDPADPFNNYYDPWCGAYEHQGQYTELQVAVYSYFVFAPF